MRTPAMITTLAAALLMASGAFAADKASGATSPSLAPAGTMSADQHPSKEQCRTEAKAKKLHGKELTKYVKQCEAGKAPI